MYPGAARRRLPTATEIDALQRHAIPTVGSLRGRTMSFLTELWAFLRVRKKVWLLPIIVVMVLLGTLLIAAQGSVLAPLIYTLF
jgi:Family of unknown function (DUF5989)